MDRNSERRSKRIAVVLLAIGAVALTAGDLSQASPATRQAQKSSLVGRYRVLVEGFSVSAQTWDNVLQSDGKGDEVFLSARVAYMDRNGKDLAPRTEFRSATMGDTNGFSSRVRAGTASDQGGIVSGNTFPDPLDLTAFGPATSPSFTPPLTLWEGDLVQGRQAVVITPSIWEWDGSGDVFGGWLQWAQTALPKIAGSIGTIVGGGNASDVVKKATQLGLDVLTVFNDPGLIGKPGDRPIGTTKNVDGKYVFVPQVVLLNYDRAQALIQQKINGVSGLFTLHFQDDQALTDYTLYFRVVPVVQRRDVTPPRVTILSPKVKPGRATLRWKAEDPYVEGARTSGVDSFDFAVRRRGRWKVILHHTDATSRVFRGKGGATLIYRVRARDVRGNTSVWTQARSVHLP
jgi:hypothetical protein